MYTCISHCHHLTSLYFLLFCISHKILLVNKWINKLFEQKTVWKDSRQTEKKTNSKMCCLLQRASSKYTGARELLSQDSFATLVTRFRADSEYRGRRIDRSILSDKLCIIISMSGKPRDLYSVVPLLFFCSRRRARGEEAISRRKTPTEN